MNVIEITDKIKELRSRVTEPYPYQPLSEIKENVSILNQISRLKKELERLSQA